MPLVEIMDTVVPDSLSPWKAVPPYIAQRIDGALIIDGRLDESCWRSATRSPRFADLVHATPGQYDTRAAVLWDDECLYVGYWVEEPHVEARHTRRDALIYEDNDVELFIAGPDAYYELEINADTGGVEAIALLLNMYVMGNLVPPIRFFSAAIAVGFCFPLQILAILLGKLLKDNGKLYLNLVCLARKTAVLNHNSH